MDRNEIIDIIYKIKMNPKEHDFSSYLYSAVGLIKRDQSAGTAHVVLRLVETIQEASGGNLSDFCKRKIEIIQKESVKPMSKLLEKMVQVMEYNDYINSIPKELR